MSGTIPPPHFMGCERISFSEFVIHIFGLTFSINEKQINDELHQDTGIIYDILYLMDYGIYSDSLCLSLSEKKLGKETLEIIFQNYATLTQYEPIIDVVKQWAVFECLMEHSKWVNNWQAYQHALIPQKTWLNINHLKVELIKTFDLTEDVRSQLVKYNQIFIDMGLSATDVFCDIKNMSDFTLRLNALIKFIDIYQKSSLAGKLKITDVIFKFELNLKNMDVERFEETLKRLSAIIDCNMLNLASKDDVEFLKSCFFDEQVFNGVLLSLYTKIDTGLFNQMDIKKYYQEALNPWVQWWRLGSGFLMDDKASNAFFSKLLENHGRLNTYKLTPDLMQGDGGLDCQLALLIETVDLWEQSPLKDRQDITLSKLIRTQNIKSHLAQLNTKTKDIPFAQDDMAFLIYLLKKAGGDAWDAYWMVFPYIQKGGDVKARLYEARSKLVELVKDESKVSYLKDIFKICAFNECYDLSFLNLKHNDAFYSKSSIMLLEHLSVGLLFTDNTVMYVSQLDLNLIKSYELYFGTKCLSLDANINNTSIDDKTAAEMILQSKVAIKPIQTQNNDLCQQRMDVKIRSIKAQFLILLRRANTELGRNYYQAKINDCDNIKTRFKECPLNNKWVANMCVNLLRQYHAPNMTDAYETCLMVSNAFLHEEDPLNAQELFVKNFLVVLNVFNQLGFLTLNKQQKTTFYRLNEVELKALLNDINKGDESLCVLLVSLWAVDSRTNPYNFYRFLKLIKMMDDKSNTLLKDVLRTLKNERSLKQAPMLDDNCLTNLIDLFTDKERYQCQLFFSNVLRAQDSVKIHDGDALPLITSTKSDDLATKYAVIKRLLLSITESQYFTTQFVNRFILMGMPERGYEKALSALETYHSFTLFNRPYTDDFYSYLLNTNFDMTQETDRAAYQLLQESSVIDTRINSCGTVIYQSVKQCVSNDVALNLCDRGEYTHTCFINIMEVFRPFKNDASKTKSDVDNLFNRYDALVEYKKPKTVFDAESVFIMLIKFPELAVGWMAYRNQIDNPWLDIFESCYYEKESVLRNINENQKDIFSLLIEHNQKLMDSQIPATGVLNYRETLDNIKCLINMINSWDNRFGSLISAYKETPRVTYFGLDFSSLNYALNCLLVLVNNNLLNPEDADDREMFKYLLLYIKNPDLNNTSDYGNVVFNEDDWEKRKKTGVPLLRLNTFFKKMHADENGLSWLPEEMKTYYRDHNNPWIKWWDIDTSYFENTQDCRDFFSLLSKNHQRLTKYQVTPAMMPINDGLIKQLTALLEMVDLWDKSLLNNHNGLTLAYLLTFKVTTASLVMLNEHAKSIIDHTEYTELLSDLLKNSGANALSLFCHCLPHMEQNKAFKEHFCEYKDTLFTTLKVETHSSYVLSILKICFSVHHFDLKWLKMDGVDRLFNDNAVLLLENIVKAQKFSNNTLEELSKMTSDEIKEKNQLLTKALLSPGLLARHSIFASSNDENNKQSKSSLESSSFS